MLKHSIFIKIAGLCALLACAGSQAVLLPFEGAQSISNGFGHACAVGAGGTVSCWGRNDSGQLGTGTVLSSATPLRVAGISSGATAVAAGKRHSCAIVAAGAVCWGANDNGQLGDGSLVDSTVPVPVQGLSSGVSAISVGDQSSCAIVNGGVRCWGYNGYGSLGDGGEDDSPLPVQVSGLSGGVTTLNVGALHACAIVNGAALCWGNNFSGQVGDGSGNQVIRTPVAVTGLASGVTAVAAGAIHTCAIVNSVAMCWGDNGSGQLGTGNLFGSLDPEPVQGLSIAPQSLALGAQHTCVRDIQAGLHCWGDGSYGQLGNNDFETQTLPVDVAGFASGTLAVGARGYSSCTLRTDQRIACWGFNAYGQLGDGSSEFRTAPFDVIGLDSGVSAIGAGSAHSCAVVNGVVQCWGYNGEGDLGNGSVSLYTSLAAPVANLAATATAVAAGYDHTCAIVAGGVWCWGLNDKGQLGIGSTQSSTNPVAVPTLANGVSAIALGGRQSCAIRNGALLCWGYNGNGELGNGGTRTSVVPRAVLGMDSGVSAVSVGPDHTCAVVNGAAKCWGLASFGQLGDGSSDSYSSVPVPVTGLAGGVSDITAGYSHSCAIAAGVAYCWGFNGYGALGDGTLDFHLTPTPVVGIDGVPSSIVAGDDISCAVVSGSARCWGSDYYGDLGNGGLPRTRRLVPTAVIGLGGITSALVVNGTHVCARTTSAGMKCWGDDFLGQLGIGRVLLAPAPLTVVVDDTLYTDGFN